MKFRFYSPAYAANTLQQRSNTAIVELESVEEAVGKLEEGSVFFSKEEGHGFIPVAFEKVQDFE